MNTRGHGHRAVAGQVLKEEDFKFLKDIPVCIMKDGVTDDDCDDDIKKTWRSQQKK